MGTARVFPRFSGQNYEETRGLSPLFPLFPDSRQISLQVIESATGNAEPGLIPPAQTPRPWHICRKSPLR